MVWGATGGKPQLVTDRLTDRCRAWFGSTLVRPTAVLCWRVSQGDRIGCWNVRSGEDVTVILHGRTLRILRAPSCVRGRFSCSSVWHRRALEKTQLSPPNISAESPFLLKKQCARHSDESSWSESSKIRRMFGSQPTQRAIILGVSEVCRLIQAFACWCFCGRCDDGRAERRRNSGMCWNNQGGHKWCCFPPNPQTTEVHLWFPAARRGAINRSTRLVLLPPRCRWAKHAHMAPQLHGGLLWRRRATKSVFHLQHFTLGCCDVTRAGFWCGEVDSGFRFSEKFWVHRKQRHLSPVAENERTRNSWDQQNNGKGRLCVWALTRTFTHKSLL